MSFSKSYKDLYLVNLFYLRSYYNLLKKNYNNYIKNNSQNKNDIFIARYYLDLLSNYRNVKIFEASKNAELLDKNILYIYGPNANSVPNKKFSSSKLILSKFPNFDISDFNSVDLYLNSFTFDQLNASDMSLLFESFTVITKSNIIDNRLVQLQSLPESDFASCLGLNRILWHLYNTLGPDISSIFLKIEGYDLYTKQNPYSGNIHSHIYYKSLFEQNDILLKGLWQHDLIFNFLDLKYIISKFKLIDSEDFINLINNTELNYWDTVTTNRI